MNRYMLDTDICIYFIKGRPASVAEKITSQPPGSVVMSVITLGELRRGAERSQHREQNLASLHALTRAIHVLPLPVQAGEVYGEIRTRLERAGTPIGGNDLWIAAHAMAAELTLVTNNQGEFTRIDGLAVENWAQPA